MTAACFNLAVVVLVKVTLIYAHTKNIRHLIVKLVGFAVVDNILTVFLGFNALWGGNMNIRIKQLVSALINQIRNRAYGKYN